MHPLSGDVSDLKDNELEEKLRELNKRLLTASRFPNQELTQQLQMLLTTYREEQVKRQRKVFDQQLKNSQQEVNSDLKELVNVDRK
jgi:hypothetical protein